MKLQMKYIWCQINPSFHYQSELFENVERKSTEICNKTTKINTNILQLLTAMDKKNCKNHKKVTVKFHIDILHFKNIYNV